MSTHLDFAEVHERFDRLARTLAKRHGPEGVVGITLALMEFVREIATELDPARADHLAAEWKLASDAYLRFTEQTIGHCSDGKCLD